MEQKKIQVNENDTILSEIYDIHFYEKLLNNLRGGIFFLDKEQKVIFWNQGAEEITGYKNSDTINKRCSDNILICVDENGKDLCDRLCPAKQTFANGEIHEMEVFLHHKDGYRLPALIRAFPFRDKKEKIIGAVGIFYDNSPKVVMPQRIRELTQMSLIDLHTEVGNNRFLEMHMNSRLKEMEMYRINSGVLFIDIDDFKNVNEEYGQKIGNKILRMVAQTLQNNIRFFDVVGRWSGEEFLVVILNVNESKLNLVANKLRLLVAQSNIMIDSRLLSVTVSIGATLARFNDTVETLVKRAEQLMYQSKKMGKNRVSSSLEQSR